MPYYETAGLHRLLSQKQDFTPITFVDQIDVRSQVKIPNDSGFFQPLRVKPGQRLLYRANLEIELEDDVF